MKRVSSRSHPSHSLLGELRALANRSLCADVLVLDARALRVWASASGDGLLMDAAMAPALRGVLEELRVSGNELLEALRDETTSPSMAPPADTAPSSEASGALGPFEVVDVLEDDGSSIVFRARLHATDTFEGLAVVRRIRASAWKDRDSILALLADTRAASQVSHDNVVQVFDVGIDDDACWIVTEDVRGIRLSNLMKSTRTAPGTPRSVLAASVVVQAADGLHAFHEQRSEDGLALDLVHGHFSPHAALVTLDGRLKLLPIGTAAHLRDRDSSRVYTAPEQANGGELDRRTDIFALGVLLWEIATGEQLLGADVPHKDLDTTQARVIRLPSNTVHEIPEALESIIVRALHERPSERFTTASELSQALRGFLKDAGVEDAEAPVRAWWGSRDGEEDVHGAVSPVPLDVMDVVAPSQKPLRQSALAHLSSNASLESIRQGKPVHLTHSSADIGYIARSFARLYLLVLVFDGEFEPSRAEVALKRSLPRVQSLMSAIAADILS